MKLREKFGGKYRLRLGWVKEEV